MQGKVIFASVVSLFLCGVSSPSQASSYVVTLAEVGSSVVATGSGQIDLTGLTIQYSNWPTFNPGMDPSGDELGIGHLGSGSTINIWYLPNPAYPGTSERLSGPANFGTGGFYAQASSSSGDAVGLSPNGLDTPTGYQSDTQLSSSTTTWDNSTFATFGINPGTYVWTWGSGPDQSFTIDVAVAPTPLPAAFPLFATGLCAFGLLGWRRNRKAMFAI